MANKRIVVELLDKVAKIDVDLKNLIYKYDFKNKSDVEIKAGVRAFFAEFEPFMTKYPNVEIISDLVYNLDEFFDEELPASSSTLSSTLSSTITSVFSKSLTDCKDPLKKSDITFEDIAGQEGVKEEITKNYIYPFTFPSLFKVKTKGILFYGPPGTGKTLLARAATAQIVGAAFFAPTPGELKGKYEGETEKNIAKVFDCAQDLLDNNSQYNTSVIFIDEFDAMASAKTEDPGMIRSVNALLQAMDGIVQRENVSVVAATNYPWNLEEAILRRFTARIFVDLPDKEAVEWLIRSALIKNFMPPDASAKDKKMYITGKQWNNQVFDIFAKYGDKTCDRTIPGILRNTSVKTSFEASDLQELLLKFLPNKDANDIIEQAKTQMFDSDAIPTTAFFGYSASDVTKIMNIAIQDAAYRALEGKFKKEIFSGTEYYVSSASGDIQINAITKTKYNRVLNFTLCPGDISTAVKKYPPTVSPKEYVKLLNYNHHGRPY